jgi:hypothetical protein
LMLSSSFALALEHIPQGHLESLRWSWRQLIYLIPLPLMQRAAFACFEFTALACRICWMLRLCSTFLAVDTMPISPGTANLCSISWNVQHQYDVHSYNVLPCVRFHRSGYTAIFLYGTIMSLFCTAVIHWQIKETAPGKHWIPR